MLPILPHLPRFFPRHSTLFLAWQDGHTASIFASQNGHLEVVRLLLDKGAKVDAVTKVQQLHTHADPDTLRPLLVH